MWGGHSPFLRSSSSLAKGLVIGSRARARRAPAAAAATAWRATVRWSATRARRSAHSFRRVCWMRFSCLTMVLFTPTLCWVLRIRRSRPRHRWDRRLCSWSAEISSRRRCSYSRCIHAFTPLRRGVLNRKRLAVLSFEGQRELPPLGREDLLEQGPQALHSLPCKGEYYLVPMRLWGAHASLLSWITGKEAPRFAMTPLH